MNRKILNASLIAVSLCSLQCYSQPYTTNVEAMGIDPYALDVTLENYNFRLNPYEKISKETLKDHGIKVVQLTNMYHDLDTDPQNGKITESDLDVSINDCVFEFPEELVPGENTILIKYAAASVFERNSKKQLKYELKIDVDTNKPYHPSYNDIRSNGINDENLYTHNYNYIEEEFYPCIETAAKSTYGSDDSITVGCGDLNMDNKVDLTDLSLLSIFLMNSNEFNAPQAVLADIDGNLQIDIADMATLKQIISKDTEAEISGKGISVLNFKYR